MGPLMRAYGFDLTFAHQTFAWKSEAQGRANVHVVIIGFSGTQAQQGPRRLFTYETVRSDAIEIRPRALNWYLVDAPHVYPAKRSEPLIEAVPPAPKQGSKPTDGGHLLVTPSQVDEVRGDAVASRYLRRYEQSKEFLYGKNRWVLWLKGATAGELRSSELLRSRLAGVRKSRSQSPTAAFQRAAKTPTLFAQDRQPNVRYLAIPEVSGSRREYIPLAYREPDVIAGNKLLTLPAAPLWLFGILQSSMWMTWVRIIVGRMKDDYSVAPDLAYSAFPWPELSDRVRERIGAQAQAVLDARPTSESLADLYDPDTMPAPLVKAHQVLDRAVDSAYGRHKHTGDSTRLPVLLRRYTELTGGELTLFDEEEAG